MLDKILAFKHHLKIEFAECDQDIEGFLIAIRQTIDQQGSIATNVSHWSNYIHAVLVATLQEAVGYALANWNSYITHANRSAEILKIKNANEGRILELFVLHSINHVFDFGANNLQIRAFYANSSVNPSYLTDDTNQRDVLSLAENERLIKNLKVLMRLRGLPQKEIWGDNDLIVTLMLNGVIQQYCIISCKTSLRERVYQSIFWAMHSRLEGIGKHVFVTPDKGTSSGSSEIGHRDQTNKAKKSRDVLESTMDRVYILRNAQEVNRSQVIKDFEYLAIDLQRWAEDIAGV